MSNIDTISCRNLFPIIAAKWELVDRSFVLQINYHSMLSHLIDLGRSVLKQL